MANRSYLYSTSRIPGSGGKSRPAKLTGMAEHRYGIPIVFKLLLSGNPRICPSSIWVQEGDIAVAGEYDAGLRKLEAFLARITFPQAQEPMAEALAFLHQPKNRNAYFVLECGEIFSLFDGPMLEQNRALLAQLQDLQPEMDSALRSLQPQRKSSRFADTPEELVAELGLGRWSNSLYFDPSGKP